MMATLREIISYVKKNFPATIVNEATGASTTFIQNATLQEMLRQLEERIERIVEGHMDEFFWNIDNECSEEIIAVLNQILGEKR